jgi:hypothetical protein
MLNSLAKIPDLKVIGRTSSFSFKGRTDDMRTIGQNHIGITAQLVDSRDGTHRWSETYHRSAGDAVDVQDEIAGRLVRELQLELVPAALVDSRSSMSRGESYDLYARAARVNRHDQQRSEEAIAYFWHTLELSPTFTPASEGLAEGLRTWSIRTT